MAPNPALATLSFAARPAVIGRYLGQLMLVVSALTLPPLAIAVYEAEYGMALRLAIAALGLGAAGASSMRIEGAPRIQANEALAVAALSYVAAALAMTYPLMWPGLGFGDALFESVSAVTTTGLSTIANAEAMPRSFLFLRAWMQWYGGLGIVVLSVALLAGEAPIARRLIDADLNENLVTTTHLYARRMLGIYLALTLVAFATLTLTGVPVFDGICHVLAAVSTGGFSTHERSLAQLSGWQRTAVMGAALAGAVSLPLYLRLYRGDWKGLLRNDELQALLAALALVAALLFVLEGGWRDPGSARLGDAVLLAVSAQTTTGFSSAAPADLTPGSKLVVLLAMTVGGCVGSTSGGIKLLRVVVAFRLIAGTIRRTSLAAGTVDELWLSGQRIERDTIVRTFTLATLFVLVVLLSWLPFLALDYDPLDALFEVVSATGTVGLSTGIVASGLDPGLKGVLCADMLLGRVEFLALLVLLYPRTWIGKKRETT